MFSLGRADIPKAFSLNPTKSNRQFFWASELSKTLALAIRWALAHTIVVRAVRTLLILARGSGEPDLGMRSKGGSHFRVI